jgi:hypothetical protein
MNNYHPFFVVAIHAHFVACVDALYSLYETRPDTHNIPQLLTKLKSDGHLSDEELASFQQRYEMLKPTWVKVGILRNNAFGHRSSTEDMSEVFQKAQLAPDDLHDLIEGTKSLLNDISYANDKSFHAFNVSATDQAVLLLEALKKAQSAA